MRSTGIYICLLAGLLTLALNSCKKDEPEVDKQAQLNSEIMQWMYDAMSEVYYWNDYLPAQSTLKDEKDPEAFYNKLLYTQEDKWSWLTDDYTGLQEEFAGTPTSMGIAPVFGRFSNTDKVFILISYVYPGSPAARAGIKRGDIILKINGADLTTENYYSLFKQESYTVTMGNYYSGSISVTSKVISLTAETINSNPVIFDTVLNVGDHKIGYLVYVEFISGDNGNMLKEFGSIIDEFKTEGVTDLVMDIRYNPGGEITAANYLASCIAPSAVVSAKNVFVKFIYNPGVQMYFETYEGTNSSNLINRFDATGHSLEIPKVYFLTGENTASASELLMIGLKPYMDVVQIGDTTYGKYTGAWVLADTNDPPKHNWAIVPIVSKYSNSVGFTDFKKGIIPDYPLEEDLFEAKQFGDIEDPLLGIAVQMITGEISGGKKINPVHPEYLRLPNPAEKLKTNLFLNVKVSGR
jgi:carboxyl-terminal processing protease